MPGRELAKLHLNFETGPRYDLGEPLSPIPDAPQKIAFDRKDNDGPGPKTTDDPTKLLLGGVVVYDNLPHTTYKVNGRTPIGWFANRYGYSEDRATNITNYPLKGATGEQVRGIIERLVYVGVESDRIINGLPDEFEMDGGGGDTSSTDRGGASQQLVFGTDGLEPNPAQLGQIHQGCRLMLDGSVADRPRTAFRHTN